MDNKQDRLLALSLSHSHLYLLFILVFLLTSGIPPLRAMKPWLQMPYSYYAWQNSGKWTRHWNGIDDKVPEIPSVCLSEGGEGGVNEATDTGKNTG